MNKRAKEIVADLNKKFAPLIKQAAPEAAPKEVGGAYTHRPDFSEAGVQGDEYAAQMDPYTIAALNNQSIAFDPDNPGQTLYSVQNPDDRNQPGASYQDGEDLIYPEVPVVDPGGGGPIERKPWGPMVTLPDGTSGPKFGFPIDSQSPFAKNRRATRAISRAGAIQSQKELAPPPVEEPTVDSAPPVDDSLMARIMKHLSDNKGKYAIGAGAAGVGALGAGMLMGGDDDEDEKKRRRR
jgi:hypothetical protein